MAAVPLPRAGPLGIGGKKELWIIRTIFPRQRHDSTSRRDV